MGDAAGKGNCTKAVAYLIKTLMIEAETRENWFPHKGTVHLQSYEACAAAHCYFKAFMLNGAIYVFNVRALREGAVSQFTKIRCYEMPASANVDLDTELDWKWAEFLLAEGIVSLTPPE